MITDRESQLVRYQIELRNALERGSPPEILRGDLRQNEALGAYRAYIGAMDPRMLEVALELTRKYGGP